MHRIALFLALLLAVPTGAVLSQAVQLEPGLRVRVWAPTPPLVRQPGRLTAFHADTMHLHLDRPLSRGARGVVVPLAQVTRLDVSRSRHSRARKALGGAIIGLVAGAAIGAASGGDCENTIVCYTPGEGAAMGGVLFSGVGALIGVLLPPSERWERVR
jgi:hypothetical protein